MLIDDMHEVSEKTKLVLTLLMLTGVGPAMLKKLAIKTGLNSNLSDLVDLFPEKLQNSARKELEFAELKAREQIEMARQANARVLSALDGDYPQSLSRSKHDPFLIYMKGKLSGQPDKSIAIIGTRNPTTHGIISTERIATYFVESGWSIVSGLALGCDSAAHEAALAAGGHTVAVLGHGLQTITPAQNTDLANRILAGGGALVSQFPIGNRPSPGQYVRRDLIQAGWCRAVFMIQSGLDGGSLHASRAAIKDKRWLVIPNPTAKDRHLNSKAIQANLLLLEGDDQSRLSLLKSKNPTDLERILSLPDKSFYRRVENKILEPTLKPGRLNQG
tara:strand:- start:2476 stop:3471 length:996 start_codon:yes stop_codon:yes gene_type:complete